MVTEPRQDCHTVESHAESHAARLNAAHWKVREASCDFFSRCSASDRAPYLGMLVARLDDEDAIVRHAAWGCVGRCAVEERAPHMGAIAALLDDEDEQMREAALRFFGQCNPEERAAYLDTVAARLGDRHWKVRAAACVFFSKCSAAERAPFLGMLSKRLCDKDGDVRNAAWRFFGGCTVEERSVSTIRRRSVLTPSSHRPRTVPNSCSQRYPRKYSHRTHGVLQTRELAAVLTGCSRELVAGFSRLTGVPKGTHGVLAGY
jgi:hypothetical protein